jgi:hypothetical protein
MLPWLMTFHAARLGLEAQNAMAFRFFSLVGESFRLLADRKKIDASPLEHSPAPIKAASNGVRRRASLSNVYKKHAASNGARRRASVSKVYKEQVRANKRTKRSK